MARQLELFDLSVHSANNTMREYKIKTLCRLPNKGLQIFKLFERNGVTLSLRNTIILSLLVEDGKTVTKEELEDEIWGHDPEGGPLSSAQVIRYLIWECRQKIIKAKLPWKIEAVRNVGYKLRDYE